MEDVLYDNFQRTAPSSRAWQTSDWGLEPNAVNVSGLPGQSRSADGVTGMVKGEADAGGRDGERSM